MTDPRHELRQGDCVEVMAAMEPDSVDAVVTDPPYLLGFMGRSWDTVARRNAQAWHERWAREAWRVLKPGGHLVAFGGTRTYHRLACAVEDAGFEVRDMVEWLYGQGFPKSRSLRDVGHPELGTALKPAHQPAILARKPLEARTVAAQVLATGTGAINVDDCRIGETGRWPANVVLSHDPACRSAETHGVRLEICVPGCPVVEINRQSGRLAAGSFPASRHTDKFRNVFAGFEGQKNLTPRKMDAGGASRFFYVAKASRAERDAGLEGFDERPLLWSSGEQNPGSFQPAGTRRAARNNHPTVKPVKLMRYLVRLVATPGGLVLDPFAGSGTTGVAAILEGFGFLGVERDPQYCEIARRRLAWAERQVADELVEDLAA